MEQHNRELQILFGAEPVDLEGAVSELESMAQRLAPMIDEVGPALRRHQTAGEGVLFEGAQGVLLDLAWGTYPFVTSSSCLPGFAAASCGIGPKLLGPVIGVMKAYATRVGSGPFPTELEDATGERMRERGAEFGTTTGRPRRCGWFDAVAARYAVEVAGIDAVAVTKLDILDGFETIKVATGYRLPMVPPSIPSRPTQRSRNHWNQFMRSFPAGAPRPRASLPRVIFRPRPKNYLAFLEEKIGAPAVIVSTGPRREETLVRGDSELSEQLRSIITG